jgi:hypothetical protein
MTRYHRSLLKAIETWRRLAVWRVPIDGDEMILTEEEEQLLKQLKAAQ